MNIFGKPKEDKYHKRAIEVSTYEYDDLRFAVEGILTDHRFKEYQLGSGAKRSPGILHQMLIHLLINKTNLKIEDIHVEMPVVPTEACLETIHCLDLIKGLSISGGFTSKVKNIAGGNKGCSHLVALLISMGPAIIQGYGAYYDHKVPGFLRDNYNIVIDTCWLWRADGPLVKSFKDSTLS